MPVREGVLTVLVVDDEREITELVRATLEDEQVRVVTASDGLEALETAQLQQPGLVFLDVDMPRMNGLDTCRRLRLDPGLCKTVIVMLTGSTRVSDRATAMTAGADAYLTKPFSPLELLAVLDKVAGTA